MKTFILSLVLMLVCLPARGDVKPVPASSEGLVCKVVKRTQLATPESVRAYLAMLDAKHPNMTRTVKEARGLDDKRMLLCIQYRK